MSNDAMPAKAAAREIGIFRRSPSAKGDNRIGRLAVDVRFLHGGPPAPSFVPGGATK
jgi:hypothetical protein